MLSALAAFDRVAAGDALLEARVTASRTRTWLGACRRRCDYRQPACIAHRGKPRRSPTSGRDARPPWRSQSRHAADRGAGGFKRTSAQGKDCRSSGPIARPRAVDSLIAASRASELEVKVSAITSLGLIGDHAAAEPLLFPREMRTARSGMRRSARLRRLGYRWIEWRLTCRRRTGKSGWRR